MTFNVLFLCTGNTCRSPMAEALMRQSVPAGRKERFDISSAGTSAAPGDPASPGAAEVMAELGIDLSGHRARPLSAALVEKADLILALSDPQKAFIREKHPSASGKTYLLSEYADKAGKHESIADPLGGDPEVYRQARDLIHKYVLMIAEKIQ